MGPLGAGPQHLFRSPFVPPETRGYSTCSGPVSLLCLPVIDRADHRETGNKMGENKESHSVHHNANVALKRRTRLKRRRPGRFYYIFFLFLRQLTTP